MNNKIAKTFIMLIIALIVIPVVVIFSMNVLFGLGIALTWKTWIAATILTQLLLAL